MVLKVIPNIKRAHKFASIWWTVAGIILMGIDVINQTWYSLPPSVMSKMPHAADISLGIFICTGISRLIVWVKPEDKPDGDQ